MFSATSLNNLDNHRNEITNNASKNQLAKRSNTISKKPTIISCVNDGCLEESKAQCLHVQNIIVMSIYNYVFRFIQMKSK